MAPAELGVLMKQTENVVNAALQMAIAALAPSFSGHSDAGVAGGPGAVARE